MISEDGYPVMFSLTKGMSKGRLAPVACTFSAAKSQAG